MRGINNIIGDLYKETPNQWRGYGQAKEGAMKQQSGKIGTQVLTRV